MRRVLFGLICAGALVSASACGDNDNSSNTNSFQTDTNNDTNAESTETTQADGGGESTETTAPPLEDMPAGEESESETGPPTTQGGGDCGNGTIDLGEQCDGADLNGLDCTQLGFASGNLACDPMTCTYDTANCVPDMGGTTG